MEVNFKRVHTGKDLTISAIVLLAGAGLFFVNKGPGICIAVCGLAMFFIYKGGYKKDGQGVVLYKKSEDLSKVCKASVMDFLKGNETVPTINKGTEGGSIRLDVFYNLDERIAYAQLYDFCNYAYEPATDIIELKGETVDTLISHL